MYCPQCDLHFSGSHGTGKCPYCGKVAEPSESDPRSGGPSRESVGDGDTLPVPAPGEEYRDPAATAPEADPRRSVRGDTTHTETPKDWDEGVLVAGKYEVVSRLGAGGFGTVYKVRHIFRKKYYALKTPHGEFVRDETFRVRFEREIEAMERFVHPDAVMIRDSGITEAGTPYYTMDFIEGESLKAVLRREGRLEIERALPIVRRVLRVLDVAHAHQIIHRDIKPDNVLLTRESGRETVKVLDFGVAKLLDLVGETASVTHGTRVGTPKYMSPEQITGGEVDARSDLFSLGIMFYEIVTGEHPFAQVNDPVRVTAAILNQAARPPREIEPSLPKTISDYILWMLDKRPKRRPESAKVLIKHLGEVEDGVSRVEPLDSLEVCPFCDRVPARPVVLRQETSVGERRSFILFSERASFGRANDPAKGVQNELIWRCLPCRSRAKDPENWQRNLTISQRLGSVRPDGSALLVEPVPSAKYGIGIGGVRTYRPVRIQSDRFHISLGDKALELDGYRVLRGEDHPDLDLSFLVHSRPEGVRGGERIGYSNSDCQINHVHFQRASNWPLHEYFLVYRQIKIGSSAGAGLRLRAPGVEGLHATMVYEEGEAFLMALSGRVVVRDLTGAGSVSPSGDGGDHELRPFRLLPLRPGLEVRIGDARLRVDPVVDSLFKTV